MNAVRIPERCIIANEMLSVKLRIGAGSREGGHLIEELANVRWDSRAHSSVHDDLVFALAKVARGRRLL